jgi:hypothetical protein
MVNNKMLAYIPVYLAVLVRSPGSVAYRKFQESREYIPNASGMFVGCS